MKTILIFAAIFIAVDVLIVAYVILKRKKHKISQKNIDEIKENWKTIIRQKDMRHAVMDADKLLDHALFLLGYKGNLGTKLKQSANQFKNLNGIWAAHKIRNNIAHQINYNIDENTYRQTMLSFKQAFMDLKIF